MKKVLPILLVLILVIITGCSKKKKLICNSKNGIMDLTTTVEYKNNTINKMLLNYKYDLSEYGDNDISSYKKQDFCKLMESSNDTFVGAIKKCNQKIENETLIVNAEIDVSKLSNGDLTKDSKIEFVKQSFENAGSKCSIK